MRAMKDSGIEWIGEIPENWKVDKVKHHLRRIDPRNPGDCMVLSLYRELGIVPKDSRDDNHNVTSLDTSNYKYVRVGDFVINKMKAWQGSVAVSDYEGIVSPAYYVYHFTSTVFYMKYFHYLLRSCYKEEFRRLSGGIREGQWDLSSEDFDNIPVLIPQIKEQIAISAYLDHQCAHIDNIIEKTKASIEEYKKLRQAVITQAVTKGVRGDRPMKESGIEWIGKIPEEWIVQKIKNLGKCRNGLTYSPTDQCDESGVLVLRSSNIQNGKLDYSDCVYVRCDISDDLMVRPNDILICSRNGSASLIGKNAIIPEGISASFGAFMMIYRCESPRYMQYILSSHIFSYYLGTFLTVSVNQLTRSGFNSIQIPYTIDTNEQAEIVSYLDKKCAEIDTLITKKEQFLTELESYKKSMIYEYVTGKKEVPCE